MPFSLIFIILCVNIKKYILVYGGILMKKIKKALSILLSLVMIIGVFTIVPFSVSAAESVS